MTAEQAVAYIEHYVWSASRPGLERTQALLHALGDPQRQLKFIHVAGSNGKGSTCAMLESILRQAGYRTGLYTSPYIQSFSERIRLCGRTIPGDRLAHITQRVRPIADAMSDHPTQFELVTAIAMVYFLEEGCDIVVLEVGMGGGLDSTNVIPAAEVAVICNIGLEHTQYLGNTLEEIATAKAGILKPGCLAVCYDGDRRATQIIAQACQDQGIPMRLARYDQVTPLSHDLSGQSFAWNGHTYSLPLLGRHQLHNAAVALETVACLRQRGWSIPEQAVGRGLAAVRWSARFEVLSRDPLVILDGGHNPQCAQALAQVLSDELPGGRFAFLLGVLADKDYSAILDPLLPLAAGFVCLTPDSPRALEGEALAQVLRAKCALPVTVCPGPDQGLAAALAQGGPVVAAGSLYLAGALRTAFGRWLRRQKIAARDALSPQQRIRRSAQIAAHIVANPAFQAARTILLYRAVRGEVRLDEVERAALDQGKRLAYPRCTGPGQMEALLPDGPEGWKVGPYGIPEPDPNRSLLIPPGQLDLILCPCTAFDSQGNRMGMGAGYYDRYLPQCRPEATLAAVAFEGQRAYHIPAAPWDHPMDLIFTECGTYRR